MATEHDHQNRLFGWLEHHKGDHPELAMAYAIPNGGKRDIVTAKRLKAEGVKAGVPDVHLPVARGGYHGLWIEMKVGDNRPTPQQIAWLAMLKEQGHDTAVCYTWQEAVDKILAYISQSD